MPEAGNVLIATGSAPDGRATIIPAFARWMSRSGRDAEASSGSPVILVVRRNRGPDRPLEGAQKTVK